MEKFQEIINFTLCYRIIARFLEWFIRRFFKVEIQVERAQFLALGCIKIATAGTRIVSVGRTALNRLRILKHLIKLQYLFLLKTKRISQYLLRFHQVCHIAIFGSKQLPSQGFKAFEMFFFKPALYHLPLSLPPSRQLVLSALGTQARHMLYFG